MTKFEYILPSQTEVSRLFVHDEMTNDVWSISLDGAQLATLDYQTAHRYLLGKITLAEILQERQKEAAETI